MLDVGSGPPVVVLPGVQGRWEWMRPAVGALAERCRVLTDSLPGERGSLAGLDPAHGFDQHVAWVDALLDRAGLRRAVVCGVSYGGLVALRYAAVRPARPPVDRGVSTPTTSHHARSSRTCPPTGSRYPKRAERNRAPSTHTGAPPRSRGVMNRP